MITDFPKELIRIRNDRRTLVRAHRREFLDHICNFSRIINDNLLCLRRAKILKLRQHFVRRMQIKGRLLVRIRKTLSCHNDPSVYLIPRIKEMHVTDCRHRLVKTLPELYDLPVYLPDVLFTVYLGNPAALDHKAVVPDRLNFQIIIEIDDFRNPFL